MNNEIPDALSALGHPGRLAVFRLLARRAPGGVRPSEIAAALGMKPNTLSVHVSTLARAGLVLAERDGRSVFYRIDLDRTGALIHFLIADCCRGRPELCAPLAGLAADGAGVETTGRPLNVLFVCTGNSARSIFAEAILNAADRDRFHAYSAGTQPRTRINPQAAETLRQQGVETAGLRSKDIETFRRPDAPQMDFVLTVCDHAANEETPRWPGQPLSAHWGVPDPVAAAAGDTAQAFTSTYRTIRHRIDAFATLPLATLDRTALQRALDEIGQSHPTP